jgi:hypothetical protein
MCSECNKVYKNNTTANRHLRTEHRGETHTCQKCGETYHRLDILKRHNLTTPDCDKKLKAKSTRQSSGKSGNFLDFVG